MSHESVGRLRKGYEAYSRGDFDRAAEGIHPNFEFVPAGGQTPLRGVNRFRAWMEPDAFESQVLEPLDFRVAGNKVLVRLRTRIKGAGSGIEAEFEVWIVWTYDDAGLAIRMQVFEAHQEIEALQAAGLPE
jgi:ketosteroid isomerase-like protein